MSDTADTQGARGVGDAHLHDVAWDSAHRHRRHDARERGGRALGAEIDVQPTPALLVGLVEGIGGWRGDQVGAEAEEHALHGGDRVRVVGTAGVAPAVEAAVGRAAAAERSRRRVWKVRRTCRPGRASGGLGQHRRTGVIRQWGRAEGAGGGGGGGGTGQRTLEGDSSMGTLPPSVVTAIRSVVRVQHSQRPRALSLTSVETHHHCPVPRTNPSNVSVSGSDIPDPLQDLDKGGGGFLHKAMVLVCLPLAAPVGLSPLLIVTLCGPECVLVVSTEPPHDLSCWTTPGVGRPGDGLLPVPLSECKGLGVWHNALVSDCLHLAVPIGLSPPKGLPTPSLGSRRLPHGRPCRRSLDSGHGSGGRPGDACFCFGEGAPVGRRSTPLKHTQLQQRSGKGGRCKWVCETKRAVGARPYRIWAFGRGAILAFLQKGGQGQKLFYFCDFFCGTHFCVRREAHKKFFLRATTSCARN